MQTLIYEALIDLEISHKKYKAVINGKENYIRLKGNIKMEKIDDELNEEGMRIKSNKNIRGNKVIFLTHIKINFTTKETSKNNDIKVIVDDHGIFLAK